jgi:DNA mismatch repair protein MutS
LKQWLNQPLTGLSRLNIRQNIVEAFVQKKKSLHAIRNYLGKISDLERILGKISRLKATPRDVWGLGSSLDLIPFLKKELEDSSKKALAELSSQFKNLQKTVKLIVSRVREDAPVSLKRGGFIIQGVDKELDELRSLSSGGKQWISDLQKSEREATGIPSLKIGFNKIFGYYIEVTKTHQHKVPDSYTRKQTLVNSERYITSELKQYEEKILSAEEKIESIEIRIFEELCRDILQETRNIQVNAKILNRLDVLSSFSSKAVRNRYVRPKLITEPSLEIKAGRHPVVEQLLPATERFIPNDTLMNIKTSQIHLITGPNMAGKSTYLRQVGLLVLMSQIGSFIPVKKAKIGIADRLFTRVGASDNLAGGESTFLVEMNEAANILNNATPQSLILLDEIGRGTATFDGLSLAWSITEHLHNHSNVGARTLFATHYHELTALENTLERLENFQAAVKEFGDKIVFLRTILPGISDKSYGIHVAQMAGLPSEVIERAKEILNFHISQENIHGTRQPIPASNQLSIFEQKENELKKAIAALDLDKMTPIQALQTLDKLKKEHGL